MAKVKNRRDNHEIKRPKTSAGYSPKKEYVKKDRPVKRVRTEERYDRPELDKGIIYGRNSVMEALKSGREIDKIMVSQREGSIIKILGVAKDKKVPISYVDKVVLDKNTGNANHQGIMAYVSPYKYSEMEDAFNLAKERNENLFLLVLDGIQDPQNLGAIIRTAECAGVHGVIIPKRHAATLTETVAKVAQGAIEYVPVIKVTNIATTIDELKEKGVWTACVDMDGKTYYDQELLGDIALVIGSEGFGVSHLVKEKCDYTVSIPMLGKITSLNASNASSIMMYEVRRQRDINGRE